ncbi:hypothetical protein GGR77_000522 [Xanthomonas translucens]
MKRSLLTVGAQHGAAQQGLQPPKATELGPEGKKNAAQHGREARHACCSIFGSVTSIAPP